MRDAGQAGGEGPSPSRSDGGSVTDLGDLLLDQLRDAFSVERQLIPALAELEAMANSLRLRRLIRKHVEETRQQVERLEKIGRARGWDLDGDPSKAMAGLIEGGRSHVAAVDFPPARDFLIVAHTHRIKHYELAAYAVTVSLADRLGFKEASELLRASRREEQAMDDSLARLASEELLSEIPSPEA